MITQKTFRLILRIYMYRVSVVFKKLHSGKVIRNDTKKYIGHGLANERYELKTLELTFP